MAATASLTVPSVKEQYWILERIQTLSVGEPSASTMISVRWPSVLLVLHCKRLGWIVLTDCEGDNSNIIRLEVNEIVTNDSHFMAID